MSSAVLGSGVAILHDFGTKESGAGGYAFFFLAACLLFGLVDRLWATAGAHATQTVGAPGPLMIAVVSFCLGNLCLFASARTLDGVDLAALGRLYLPFCALLAIFAIGERFSGRQLALASVLIVVSLQPLTEVGIVTEQRNAVVLCVLAYFCFAVYYTTLSWAFKAQAVRVNAQSAFVALLALLAYAGVPSPDGALLPIAAGAIFSLSHKLFYMANRSVSFLELNLYRVASPLVVVLVYGMIASRHVGVAEVVWVGMLTCLYAAWFLCPPAKPRRRQV
ncbi:hypothetical protein [Salinarimonas sp.]|uniref:hypothetical protein n=1 Tax=Salinarimonas sp. TaxID=2766526 RepID=UPI0032D8BE87